MPIKFLLSILSVVYGLVIYGRVLLYKIGIFKTTKVPLKIVSVGNLSLGGTGKTPFTIMLAKLFKDELGKEACVLTRGYGWDEQVVLKKRLDDVPILVGENRVRSAERAVNLYGVSAGILDDGFQHWELARDIDIVLVDSRSPFGNGALFPRGVLRESVGALQRADIVVLTKTDDEKEGVELIKNVIRPIKPEVIFLTAMHKGHHFNTPHPAVTHDCSYVKGKRVLLFSGIGDPSYFEEMMSGYGAEIASHLVFCDHRQYRKRDLDEIMRKCEEMKADIVVTTEKDIVKLNRMGLFIKKRELLILVIEMVITSGKEDLVARLRRLYRY